MTRAAGFATDRAVDRATRIAGGSIAVGLLVVGLKGLAWWLTRSAALYSDALESMVNVAAAAMAFAALWWAAQPADANHLYGHGKAEFFAAIVEGGLIVAAAVLILERAWAGWWHPVPLALLPSRAMSAGIAANLLATALNGFWAWLLRGAGRRWRSPALVADARHLLTDVIASLGVVAGVAVAWQSGIPALDPILAALVAGYILLSGFVLMRDSVGGLMDAAPSPEVVERIRRVVSEHAEGALEAHDLRSRRAGQVAFLEFHLVVPGAMSVATAHAICDRIEAALRADFAGLVITIHVEPEAKAKHQGVLVL